MKQLLLAFAACSLLATSCQKNESPVPENPVAGTDLSGKKYPVVIRLGDFIQRTEEMGARNTGASGTRDSTLHQKVSYIQYLAFPESAYGMPPVSKFYQNALRDPLTFGTVRDSLPEGNYTVLLVASVDSILPVNDDMELRLKNSMYDLDLLTTKDVYTKKLQLQITAAGTSVINDVTLDRCMGKLELQLLDGQQMEDSGKTVTVEASPLNYKMNLGTGVVHTDAYHYGTPQMRKIDANHYEIYALPTSPVTLRVICTAPATTAYTVKTLQVALVANRKTIVTGYVGATPAPSGNSNWDILLNQVFDGETHVEL